MRVASSPSVLPLLTFVALGLALTGCPEKAGAPADKTVAEPERAEPDDDAKGDEKAKKPAAAAPAPAAAPAAADEKKPDDGKDEGGW